MTYCELPFAVSGSVVAWGGNTFQQTNVPREALSSIAAVAAGHAHSLALTARTGAVLAWGGGYDEQTIVPRVAQSGAVAVAAGASQSLALLGNGTVIAWGKGGEAVVPFAAQSNVVAIAVSGHTTIPAHMFTRPCCWICNTAISCQARLRFAPDNVCLCVCVHV